MRTRVSLMVLLAAGILLAQGCEKSVSGPTGAPGATYKMGVLTSHVPTDINATYQAAEQAMKNLDLIVVQSTGGQLGSVIVARDAHDKRIKVDLTSVTQNDTKLTVNSGSKASATRIYQEIMVNLPPVTAQAAPTTQP